MGYEVYEENLAPWASGRIRVPGQPGQNGVMGPTGPGPARTIDGTDICHILKILKHVLNL